MRILGHDTNPTPPSTAPAWRRPRARFATRPARHPSPRAPTSEPGGRPGAMRARSPNIHAVHQHTHANTQRAHRAPTDEPNRRAPLARSHPNLRPRLRRPPSCWLSLFLPSPFVVPLAHLLGDHGRSAARSWASRHDRPHGAHLHVTAAPLMSFDWQTNEQTSAWHR